MVLEVDEVAAVMALRLLRHAGRARLEGHLWRIA